MDRPSSPINVPNHWKRNPEFRKEKELHELRNSLVNREILVYDGKRIHLTHTYTTIMKRLEDLKK